MCIRDRKSAVLSAFVFCVIVSTLVCVFARPLMELFIHPTETEIIRVGVEYLRIEASFYIGIGLLFLLYGFYRAMNRPGMSVVLTVISLGTRVALDVYKRQGIPCGPAGRAGRGFFRSAAGQWRASWCGGTGWGDKRAGQCPIATWRIRGASI